MEFFESILPFLIFIGAGIIKSRNKSNKDKDKNKKRTSSPSPRVNPSNTLKSYLEDTREAIKKQIDEITKPDDENVDIIEEKEEIQDTKKTYKEPFKSKVPQEEYGEMEPGVSPILKNEIGRESPIAFNRSNLVKGIIMSEVLGKPKALRK